MEIGSRLFVSPLHIQSIVPYWTTEEAEECARMACAIIRDRIKNGSDLAYEADDFRSGAYKGIILAKKRYERNGERLQVKQCRGYIRTYTGEEVQKKSRSKSLDVLHSGRKNLVYDMKAAESDSGESKEPNLQDAQEELENYIKHFHYNLLFFAKAFLSGQNSGELKAKFGSKYSKLKKEFEAVAKTYTKAARPQ